MRTHEYSVIPLLFTFLASACTPSGDSSDEPDEMAAPVVELILDDLTITGPDEIPSGWTTFRVNNKSAMTHFVLLDKMSEGKTVEDHLVVAGVFQKGMDLLNAGKQEEAFAVFGELPEWFGEVVFSGGPGFLGPGRTLEITLFVEPGMYVAECYVKTNGIFHSYNPNEGEYGMVHQMRATEVESELAPPVSTIKLTISSERGIEGGGDVMAGEHTVAVRFEDQVVHEHFLGHDVHLIRLEDDTDVDALHRWMNYLLPEGLETPAPVTFLGGTNEMPAGNTAYFSATLEAGRYAWISEVPDPAAKGMYIEFQVR